MAEFRPEERTSGGRECDSYPRYLFWIFLRKII